MPQKYIISNQKNSEIKPYLLCSENFQKILQSITWKTGLNGYV